MNIVHNYVKIIAIPVQQAAHHVNLRRRRQLDNNLHPRPLRLNPHHHPTVNKLNIPSTLSSLADVFPFAKWRHVCKYVFR